VVHNCSFLDCSSYYDLYGGDSGGAGLMGVGSLSDGLVHGLVHGLMHGLVHGLVHGWLHGVWHDLKHDLANGSLHDLANGSLNYLVNVDFVHSGSVVGLKHVDWHFG